MKFIGKRSRVIAANSTVTGRILIGFIQGRQAGISGEEADQVWQLLEDQYSREKVGINCFCSVCAE